MAEKKVQRICAGCLQTDDHPRHVFAVAFGTPPMPWHMDCHAAATGCETCIAQVEAADGAKGEQLQQRLVELSNNDSQEG